MQAKEISERIENTEKEVKKLAGVIDELQAIVECPEGHWTKVVREFKLANETLRQKKDQLILLLASTMVSVAMTRAIEIVSRSISDITMVTLEALDLDGYVSHCYGNKKGSYPTQLPWLRGKVFDVTETFRGQRLIDWMINMASVNHHKAFYICQLLLEMGIYIQIGVNSEHEMFQPHSFYQWNIISDKSLFSEQAALPRRLSSDVWPPPQALGESKSFDCHKCTDKG